jgi:hypothetical protein
MVFRTMFPSWCSGHHLSFVLSSFFLRQGYPQKKNFFINGPILLIFLVKAGAKGKSLVKTRALYLSPGLSNNFLKSKRVASGKKPKAFFPTVRFGCASNQRTPRHGAWTGTKFRHLASF